MGPAGTFSAATLSRHPTSFMVAPPWAALLRASAQAHGSTWLHEYHLGVAALDAIGAPFDASFNASAAHFAASNALQESAEALRGPSPDPNRPLCRSAASCV